MVWAWLGEENARLLLLGALLLLYMCAGALIFRMIEEDYNPNSDISTATSSTNSVEDYETSLNTYLGLQPNMTDEQLDALLNVIYSYGNSTLALATSKPKWDFADGFHFAATIVSTIGKFLSAFKYLF
ncbi:hypothetical protein O3M35_007204 [Rhynocoris fuscipes]|uniref:Uncharacterized protein n=1 Tax=Rhynocoris fuscipes TaxID=488301 RepID=A0AAW1D9X4_9HEMI